MRRARSPLSAFTSTGLTLVAATILSGCELVIWPASTYPRLGPDPGREARIEVLRGADGTINELFGTLVLLRDSGRVDVNVAPPDRLPRFCGLDFLDFLRSIHEDEFITDMYMDYEERRLVVATWERVYSLYLDDGTVTEFVGLPEAARVFRAFGGAPGVTYAAVNMSGGRPGIHGTVPGGRTFLPVQLFPETGDDSYAIRAFSTALNYVALGHGGAGVSLRGPGMEEFKPWNDGLPLPFSVGGIAIGPTYTLVGGDKGLFRADSMGGRWSMVGGLPPHFVGSVTAEGMHAWIETSPGTGPNIFRSSDGGRTFSQVVTLRVGYVTSMTALPGGRVAATTNAGTYVGDGTSWIERNQEKASARVNAITALGLSFRKPGAREPFAAPSTLYIATGASGNGLYRSTDSGRTWTPGPPELADQFLSALAVSGSTVMAAPSAGLFRSTDGGATFTRLGAAAGLPAERVQALAVFGGTVLGGTFRGPGVIRSTDLGATWARANGLAADATFYAFRETSNGILGGSVNRTWRSTDGGASWRQAGAPPAGTFFSVTALAGSAANLFAAVTDFNSPPVHGVFASTDAGATWTRRSEGLPATNVLALHTSGSAVLAGTIQGVYRSTDGGLSWQIYDRRLRNSPVLSLAEHGDTLFAGTFSDGVVSLPARPRAERLVPIVLDVSTAQAHFTTELAVANRGTTDAAVTMRYTAALGRREGSGTVNDTLPAGRQLLVPDVLAYLRAKGLGLPPSSSDPQQGGTLLITLDGISELDVVGVTARTAAATSAPQPVGRAGLAYAGIDPGEGRESNLAVYGLRSDAADRSNLAVFSTSDEEVTVKVTAFSGIGEGPPVVIHAGLTLGPYGWFQFNGILGTARFTNGYVLVERVSAKGRFSAYGIVNDQGTSDGSFLPPFTGAPLGRFANVPVLVEAGPFVSELVLANLTSQTAEVDLVYRESLSPAAGAGGTLRLALTPGEQRIIPDAVQFLRQGGVAVGARGAASYAGLLHVESGVLAPSVYAAARTASRSPAAGQFGLFTPGAFLGQEADAEAWIYGLTADEDNRSNVAAMNTARSGDPITLELQAYDGDAAGVPRGAPVPLALAPGQWTQINGFLASAGVRNGWVRVRRIAGRSPWIAYGVVNDGGGPGQRTGDGAYVPMVR